MTEFYNFNFFFIKILIFTNTYTSTVTPETGCTVYGVPKYCTKTFRMSWMLHAMMAEMPEPYMYF